ncbi:MAG: tetratricopeptide repeat protein [Nitrospira sp.]|nr:tetratricopeptide repeat protein [Nitrospira sp.]
MLDYKMSITEAIQSALQLYQSGDLHHAKDYFEKILEVQPNNAEILYFLGIVYAQLEKPDLAMHYIKNSLQYNADNADAYFVLGLDYQKKGNIDEAISHYQRALQINPDLPRIYNNMGMAYQAKGCFNEALECYQKAVTIDPHLPEAQYNLGNLLHREGKQSEALFAYDKAIEINPKFLIARWAKCIAQLQIIYPDQSDVEISRRRYEEELLLLRKAIVLDTPEDSKVAAETVGIHQPFYLAYQGFNDRELQRIYGELVCQIMQLAYPEFSIHSETQYCYPEQPVRVGIVAGFFHNHPVWRIIIKGWAENLDKKKINLYGYYTGKKKDDETDKARHCFVRFIENTNSFEDLCKTIQNDNLHVIIYPEIGMDFLTLRLAALRLAPVQCASWGHPVASGLPTIDYYLSGDLMEPANAQEHYTEKLIRLPNLSVYYSPDVAPDSAVDRDTFGLRPKSIRYHCCQTLYKYLPQYDEVFPRIAQQTGDCQFLFSSFPEINTIIEQFKTRIFRKFKEFNLDANNHIVFLPALDKVKYKALNKLCDVFLDPIGWSGCTSTLEAIDCNLPVVAFPSLLMRGRESAAILTMMGLKETIAASLEEYVLLAVNLGKDSEWRREISEKIARNKHIIYSDRICIAALEDFFEQAVKEKLLKL